MLQYSQLALRQLKFTIAADISKERTTMLDVYELNVFLNAAETENFSQAARHLNLTQPAVSMQIRGLERKLGLELFHRHGRTLALTEQGRALIPLARDMIRRSIQIEEEVESLKGDVAGHLKIGCSTTSGKYFLPSLVARFRRCYPRVQVSIYNHSRDTVLTELGEGLVQLAMVSAQPTCSDVDYRHFFDDYVVLVVPITHPWARKDVIAPDALRGADFILRGAQASTREEVAMALYSVGLTMDELNVVMEIGNTEAVTMAVEEGIGAAFVSRTVARRGIKLGKLKEVRVAGMSLRRQIFIARSRRYPATRTQNEFWDFVQEPENEEMLAKAA
jgi:LysR family transcriptional regulator, transcriptional activator of the cysJI operon